MNFLKELAFSETCEAYLVKDRLLIVAEGLKACGWMVWIEKQSEDPYSNEYILFSKPVIKEQASIQVPFIASAEYRLSPSVPYVVLHHKSGVPSFIRIQRLIPVSSQPATRRLASDYNRHFFHKN